MRIYLRAEVYGPLDWRNRSVVWVGAYCLENYIEIDWQHRGDGDDDNDNIDDDHYYDDDDDNIDDDNDHYYDDDDDDDNDDNEK